MKIRDILREDDVVLKNMPGTTDPEDIQDPNLQPKGDPQVTNINGQPLSPVALQQALSHMQNMTQQSNTGSSTSPQQGSSTSSPPNTGQPNNQQPNLNATTPPAQPAAPQSNLPNAPGVSPNASTQMDTTYGAVPAIGPGGAASNIEVKEGPDDLDKHYNDWLNSEHAPFDDEAGDDNLVINKAMHFLHGRVHPDHLEQHAHKLASKFHGDDENKEFWDREAHDRGEHYEGHRDLISQGNKDVGGDATDDFINQIRDKGFEKAARHGNGSLSPLSEEDQILLNKMLSIAGLR